MLRFSKPLAIALALFMGLAGLGWTLEGTIACTGSGSTPHNGAPCLEAVLDEATESLAVTGHGDPLTAYAFRFYFSIDGSTWQHLGPIPGYFDANGGMAFSIPLSVFNGFTSVDALMDLSVWSNSGGTSQFVTSMTWGMIMRDLSSTKFRKKSLLPWTQWNMPLPGTDSPTFTMSMGAIPSQTPQPGQGVSASVFVAGPGLLLQALYATGIEGMLPVN